MDTLYISLKVMSNSKCKFSRRLPKINYRKAKLWQETTKRKNNNN